MINLIEKIENFLLALCTLSDNSFLKLFFTYIIFIVIYRFLTVSLEKYFGLEIKTRLHDLIFIFFIFGMFAWNSYHLYIIKIQEGISSYKIKKKD